MLHFNNENIKNTNKITIIINKGYSFGYTPREYPLFFLNAKNFIKEEVESINKQLEKCEKNKR